MSSTKLFHRDLRCFYDDYRVFGDVPHPVAGRGGDIFNGTNDVHTADDFAENAVSPAFPRFGPMVQKIVVFDIDKKLSRGRMRIGCPGHGNGTEPVEQAIVGFIVDGWSCRFLPHLRVKSTALDHESWDHTMK